MASVEERVKQIIVEQLGVDEAEVTPTASSDDLGRLVTRWNGNGVRGGVWHRSADEDAEKMTTVKDAVEYIDKHSKGK